MIDNLISIDGNNFSFDGQITLPVAEVWMAVGFLAYHQSIPQDIRTFIGDQMEQAIAKAGEDKHPLEYLDPHIIGLAAYFREVGTLARAPKDVPIRVRGRRERSIPVNVRGRHPRAR